MNNDAGDDLLAGHGLQGAHPGQGVLDAAFVAGAQSRVLLRLLGQGLFDPFDALTDGLGIPAQQAAVDPDLAVEGGCDKPGFVFDVYRFHPKPGRRDGKEPA